MINAFMPPTVCPSGLQVITRMNGRALLILNYDHPENVRLPESEERHVVTEIKAYSADPL
ncbi:hypothetical protein [Zymomonas mobilis]|uniref:hypothetical protein n=1 Tax=Zymomonas mobilis TaxID=542 RepID=UPI00130E2374|nr:hypothetical protein [Zymomonas mobilis]MDX5948112.1 hypothetical protein [Zymomonas mobilis subsp. pomaceae]